MSSKEKKQLVVVGILSVVLVFMVFRAVHKVRTGKILSIDRSAMNVPEAVQEDSVFQKLDKESQDIEWDRDPFFPPEKAPATTLILQGIYWENKSPVAIINNEIVQVGYSINGKAVKEIWEDRVILSDGKTETELRMFEEK